MAMLPSDMAQWARAADLHAQLVIERIDVDDEVPAQGHDARVSGAVARVFRGDHSLVGQRRTWVVEVLVPGDAPPPSGTMWTRLEDLRSVRVLEAYVSVTDEGEHRVVLGMTSHLDAPTDLPQAQHFEHTGEGFEQAAEGEGVVGPARAHGVATAVKVASALALLALLAWAYSLWAWSR